MKQLAQILSVDEMKSHARSRLPRIVFDYVEGGLGSERGILRNEQAFAQRVLLPRFLQDVSVCDTSATLFGKRHALPFGIAPTGGAGLLRGRGDTHLVNAARASGIPIMLSGASDLRLEDAAALAPDNVWFQLYAARDRAIVSDMIARSAAAGIETLVLTVDTPARRRRERNSRNGFSYNPRLTPRIVADGLLHPAWLADYLRHGGAPSFRNWEPYANHDRQLAVELFHKQSPAVQSWEDIALYRSLWPRNFVLKGILHPEDARIAAVHGVDGIIVSNHGGRQLDEAVASLDALPGIAQAVGDRMTVMLDSGVRTGGDVITALALGAKFVFVGRATLYGLAVGGEAGVRRVIDILAEDLAGVMAMTGCATLNGLPADLAQWDRVGPQL